MCNCNCNHNNNDNWDDIQRAAREAQRAANRSACEAKGAACCNEKAVRAARAAQNQQNNAARAARETQRAVNRVERLISEHDNCEWNNCCGCSRNTRGSYRRDVDNTFGTNSGLFSEFGDDIDEFVQDFNNQYSNNNDYNSNYSNNNCY